MASSNNNVEVAVVKETTSVSLTRHEIEDIVSSAVTRAFQDLGIAGGHNLTITEANEFRSDLQFLRDWRELCEMMRHKGVATGIMMMITALAVVMLLGIKTWIFQ